MAEYIRKEIVEARQYEGPRITVVSDQFGEQAAVSGDWLVGTERGKVHVVSAADFAAYTAYTPTAEDEALKAAQAEIDDLKAKNEALTAAEVGLQEQLALVNDHAAHLSAQITDQSAVQAQNVALTEQLAAAQAKVADLQGKFDALTAVEKHRADAQAALEAAQASVADLTK